MALTKAQQAKQRLNEINKEHRAAHAAAHSKFNKAFDQAMARHNLVINTLHDVHAFPLEFHEDEELAAARADFHSEMAAVNANRQSHVSRLPYAGVRFVRAMKTA
jgi:hypothetical protein